MSNVYALRSLERPAARAQEDAPLLLVLRGSAMTEHFASLLRNAGYPVVQAASPAEAQLILSRHPVRLALVDVEWGRAQVVDLAEAKRQQEQPCPVGVVVGWWDERVAEVYHTADFLVYKPPTERQLLSAVESVVPWQSLSA